ncbi:MAG: pseudoazurin [Cardiobacteriaceae bacterium]|nr:pseudoazurin [Cardiobacteriaceae bacterium]
MNKKSLLAFMLFSACSAYAAEHEIKMLDIGSDKQPMVFEPAVLKIAPGDTVTFIPTTRGHSVESKIVPEGAESFKSELDQKYSVTLEKEGVYVYVCPPHSMMNMAGVIQVGQATNLKAVQAALPKLERRGMSNKGRLTQYVEKLAADNHEPQAQNHEATTQNNENSASVSTENKDVPVTK